MMNEMTAKKLAEVLKDPAAKERVEQANGFEEAAAILNEYGVEFTADELEKMVSSASGDELSLESLDQVAGGAWWKKVGGHIWSCLNGLLDGFLGGYSN